MTISALNASLDALESALQEQALEAAGDILDQHDAALKALLQHPLQADSAPALRALSQRHTDILGRMQTQREQVAAKLREGQLALHAARAYQQAESLR